MSNVKYYLQAIREQTDKIEKLTFKDVIEANFKDQTKEEIDEAYDYYISKHIYNDK